jgi:carboxymethylenebutenolidase
MNAQTSQLSLLPQGFPAAIRPLRAAPIHTDSSGIVAGEVEIDAGDVRIPGYRAKPASGTSFPVVLVVQEIFGIHEHIQDLCRRFAKSGYLAVAPSVYHRQGDPSRMTDMQEIFGKIVSKVPDAQVMSDLDRSVTWAAGDGGDTNRLAITGFCWGGRIVWLYAAHSDALKAGAAWYGKLATPPSPLQPSSPITAAKDLKAPVLGLYGGKDQGIPLDTVEMMRDAIRAANKPSEIHVYPDAEHGFNADYRPSYNEVDAKDGWKRMLEFFRKHGAV